MIDGGPYDAIVQSMLPDATPWVVEITDFDLGVSPYVTTRIALEDDVADITGHVVHVCLIENDCLYSGDYEQDVLRDIVDDIAITIARPVTARRRRDCAAWATNRGMNSARRRAGRAAWAGSTCPSCVMPDESTACRNWS